MIKRNGLFAAVVIAAAALLGCASNGQPFYQTGPGWDYYYDHFRPELTRIGAGNSPASGDAYETDPQYFFWNHLKVQNLSLGMKDADVLKNVALRPDRTYTGRDRRNRWTERWIYRKDCSGFLKQHEVIPRSNVLITLDFVDGKLVGWDPSYVPVVSADTPIPTSSSLEAD